MGLKRISSYHGDGTPNYYCEFVYDGSGKLAKQLEYDANGSVTAIALFADE